MTNRHVNAIAGRLSLRPPQRRPLELLDRVTEAAPQGDELGPERSLLVLCTAFRGRDDFPNLTVKKMKLRHLYELAERAGGLKQFLVFGSFLSVTAEPRDVDVALVMAADFRLEDAPRESKTLFSHADAEARFGASVFRVREGMLPEDLMKSFLETWQRKRDGTKRGILEIKP